MRPVARCLVVFLALSIAPAQARADATLSLAPRPGEAPSLAVPRDAERPRRRTALWVDPVGMARREVRIAVHRAFAPRQAVGVAPALVLGHGALRASLDVDYAVFFLGRGIEGPFVAPLVGVTAGARARDSTLRAGLVLGYVHAFVGALLGTELCVCAERAVAPDAHVVRAIRLRLVLGYAFF